jgi:primosomal protein N' (replication factor Y)
LEAQYVIPIAVPRPLDSFFTYAVPDEWLSHAEIGNWVEIPFGRSKTYGFIAGAVKGIAEARAELPADVAVKFVTAIGQSGRVIPQDVWKLCEWAANYYHVPLGEVLNVAAPAASIGLRSRKKEARAIKTERTEPRKHVLNSLQSQAVEGIWSQREAPTPCLLHGVTGSGKTEVYLELARRVLDQGKGVLVLVPEIALTPQLNERFEAGLGRPVALWHSALADGKRRDLSSALRNGEIQVVVGARSAVFAPVQNLGMIIVDEEHDLTYKQEDRLRYHARDLAIVRATQAKALCILGSATPSFETLERCEEGRYKYFSLPERAVSGATLPSLEIVDLTQAPRVEGTQAPIAEQTLQTIRETVARGEQVMVFLNRRGFAAFLICEDCGETSECPHCSISLTVHNRRKLLKCHTCGHQEAIPLHCQKCQGLNLAPMGAGTESLEEQIPRLLPDLRILRLDRDTVTSATRLEKVLDSFRAGEADVLLGTQMLVKGHDFPQVTLVVVILADELFRWPDFRSTERAFQILTQVAGRAGRSSQPGKVLIQTYSVDHPILKAVIDKKDARTWYLENERDLRRELRYPPFARLARLRIEGKDKSQTAIQARQLADAVQVWAQQEEGVDMLGPNEAAIEKVKDTYRWEILLKGKKIPPLHKVLHRVRCSQGSWTGSTIIDVDPSGMG